MRFEFKDKGDTVTPTNADPLKALPAAVAFIDALRIEAAAAGRTLSFTGVAIEPGSFAVVTEPNNKTLALEMRKTIERELRSGKAHKKPHLLRLLKSSEESGFSSVTIRAGARAKKLDLSALFLEEETTWTEIIEERVVFLGMTASESDSTAEARFSSVLTPSKYRLRVDPALEARLNPLFRLELDITAEIEREEGRTTFPGKLIRIEEVEQSDEGALEAWRKWFVETGSADAWAKVTPEQYAREREEDL